MSENLIFLDVSYNDLTGDVPDLKKLTKLRAFNCKANQLDGEIRNFGSLPELEFFSAGTNSLKGPIPNMASLPSLREFSCVGNSLSGEIPNLENCRELEFLNLAANELQGSIPQFKNPLLSSVYLSRNQLSGSIPEGIGSLSNMDFFKASGNKLVGCVPEDFKNLCDGNTDLSENERMSWGGSMGRFCTNDPQKYAPCSIDGQRGWMVRCECELVTNISDRDDGEIEIFPNPTDGLIHLQMQNFQVSRINIYDLSGTLLISTSISSSIDLNDLQAGTYLTRIQDVSGNISNFKIVKL